MNRISGPLILLLTLLLAACAAPKEDDETGAEVLPAELLQNALLCGGDLREPGARWIGDAAALAARYRHIDGEQVFRPDLDFERYGVLLVTMGERPTTGYRLNFLAQQHRVWVRDGTLRVRLAWQTPPPDSQQAQVITHPCLLLRLPERDFTDIRILDQDGSVRLSTGRSDSRAAGS